MCVLGDMNTDFSRVHSWHTQALNRFIEHENLYVALQHRSSSISYSYSNRYSQCYSILDIPIDHHIHVPINHKPRKKWNIASNDQIGNYKLALDNSLTQIVIFLVIV